MFLQPLYTFWLKLLFVWHYFWVVSALYVLKSWGKYLSIEYRPILVVGLSAEEFATKLWVVFQKKSPIELFSTNKLASFVSKMCYRFFFSPKFLTTESICASVQIGWKQPKIYKGDFHGHSRPPQNLTKLLAPHRGKIRICPKSKKVSTYCVVSSAWVALFLGYQICASMQIGWKQPKIYKRDFHGPPPLKIWQNS